MKNIFDHHKDLFGDYADPWRKKKLKNLVEKEQPKEAAVSATLAATSDISIPSATLGGDGAVSPSCFLAPCLVGFRYFGCCDSFRGC